jgi:hypothetical protein
MIDDARHFIDPIMNDYPSPETLELYVNKNSPIKMRFEIKNDIILFLPLEF